MESFNQILERRTGLFFSSFTLAIRGSKFRVATVSGVMLYQLSDASHLCGGCGSAGRTNLVSSPQQTAPHAGLCAHGAFHRAGFSQKAPQAPGRPPPLKVAL
jgi:hypothetical protein